MFRNFFGRSEQYADVQGNAENIRRRNRIIVFIIIGAIVFLALSGRSGGKKEQSRADTQNTAAEFELGKYEEETERRLCSALSQINGAGDVAVMVTFDGLGEKVLAKNSKSEQGADTDGEKSTNKTQREESVMVYGSASSEQPYVIREKLPVPSGVFVTASGAADESVKLEIYEAVKALYGISGNRIKIAAKSGK